MFCPAMTTNHQISALDKLKRLQNLAVQSFKNMHLYGSKNPSSG